MKEKGKKIFAVILLLFFVGYLLGTGVYDLLNTKDMRTVKIDGCVEILQVEHSINGLIPTGKDHYFLGVNYDDGTACMIKASNGWYKKNFDAEKNATTPGGLVLTVLSKRISDHDVREELAYRAQEIGGVEVFSISPEYVLDVDYQIKAIGKLALVVLGIILAVIVAVVSKSGKPAGKATGIVVLIIAVLILVLILQVIR